MESGLPPPSLVMTSRPPLGPITLGVKTTPIEHDKPAPRFPGHKDVSAKSIGPPMFWMATARFPLFLTVTLSDRLGDPTSWLPKSRDGGFSSIGYAASPVPTTPAYAGSPA